MRGMLLVVRLAGLLPMAVACLAAWAGEGPPQPQESSADAGLQKKWGVDIMGPELVLRTMNREELLDFCLDRWERILEMEEVRWVQDSEQTGHYWPEAMEAAKKSLLLPYLDNCDLGAMIALLLKDRLKPAYTGLNLTRETLIKRIKALARWIREHPVPSQNAEIFIMQYSVFLYLLQPFCTAGEFQAEYYEPLFPDKRDRAPVSAADKDRIYEAFRKRQAFDWNACYGGDTEHVTQSFPGLLWRPGVKDKSQTLQYWFLLHYLTWFTSSPIDRANRWTLVGGHSLAEHRALQWGVKKPDFTAEHHNHQSHSYVTASTSAHLGWHGMFAACEGLKQFPPNVWDPALSNLPGLFKQHKDVTSFDGTIVWPWGVWEYYESPLLTCPSLAYAATIFQDSEAQAYLSRAIQTWGGGYQGWDYLWQRILAYVMVRELGFGTGRLLSMEEAQARHGGTTRYRYQHYLVHRNPFKYVCFNYGPPPPFDRFDTSPFLAYEPAPWKAGHVQKFTKKFRSADYRDHSCGSILGQFPTGEQVFYQAQARLAVWDDGFRATYAKTGRRGDDAGRTAFFSLGGKVSAVLEHSPAQGGLAPLDLNARRSYPVATETGVQDFLACQPVTTRWFCVDDRAGAVLPRAEKLSLKAVSRQIHEPQVGWSAGRKPLVNWKEVPSKSETEQVYFEAAGGEAFHYAATEAKEFPALAAACQVPAGLPAGWRGLEGRAPEGYRLLVLARFEGEARNFAWRGSFPEGAPIFSRTTAVTGEGSEARFELGEPLSCWSEEVRFLVKVPPGKKLIARQLRYNEARLENGGEAAVTAILRYRGGAPSGKAVVEETGEGLPAAQRREVDAAGIRGQGVEVVVPAKGSRSVLIRAPEDSDLLGPYVDVTFPEYHRPVALKGAAAGRYDALAGKVIFKADAGDRSGVERVEFYLNKDQLIGSDTEAPYECEYEVKETYTQVLWAKAYDRAGNSRESFRVPFGDGTLGPPLKAAPPR